MFCRKTGQVLWNKTWQDKSSIRGKNVIDSACLMKAFQNEVGHLNSDGAGMCFTKIPDRFMEQNSDKYFDCVVGKGSTYVRSSEFTCIISLSEVSIFILPSVP